MLVSISSRLCAADIDERAQESERRKCMTLLPSTVEKPLKRRGEAKSGHSTARDSTRRSMSFSLAEDDGNDVAEMNSFAGFPSQGLLRRCFAAWSSALAEVCSGHCYCGAVRFEVSTHPKPLMPTYCHWYASLSLLRARALSLCWCHASLWALGTSCTVLRLLYRQAWVASVVVGSHHEWLMAVCPLPFPKVLSGVRYMLVRRSGSQVYCG